MLLNKTTSGLWLRILVIGSLFSFLNSAAADRDKEKGGEGQQDRTPVQYQFFIDDEFFGVWKAPELKSKPPKGPGLVTLLEGALGMTAAEYEEFLKKVAESKLHEQNCSLVIPGLTFRFRECRYVITDATPSRRVNMSYQRVE